MKESLYRSIVKGISWRIFATIDTIFLVWIITGHFENALKIGLGEVFTKTLLYFLHERIWNRILQMENKWVSHSKSLLKGVSWRFFGTIDTFMIAFFFTGQPFASTQIVAFEVVTKIILYYFHERLWEYVKWGKLQLQVQETTIEDCINCQ